MPDRVLFVTSSGTLGGASLALLDVLQQMGGCGIEPVVLVSEDGPLVGCLARRGVQIVRVYQPWWVTGGGEDAWLYSMKLLPKAIRETREVLRGERISAVFTNTSVTPAAAFAAALEAKPHVWMAREIVGTASFLGPLDAHLIFGTMAALSSKVIANSTFLAQTILQVVPNAEIAISFSGVNTQRFANCRPAPDTRRVLAIGTTTPEKGLDDLVQAAALMVRGGCEFCFNIVGDFDHASYEARIRQQLRQLHIERYFEFTKHQEDIRPLLNRSAVFCQPSHSEGMSLTVVEAMAAGLPVVSTDCGGPRDLVEVGKTGTLVPVKKPDTLAQALMTMLDDPDQRASMGAAGRRRALQSFDLQATAAHLLDLVEETIQSPAAGLAKPWAELLTRLLEVGGPRILLGKKWRLLRPLLGGA